MSKDVSDKPALPDLEPVTESAEPFTRVLGSSPTAAHTHTHAHTHDGSGADAAVVPPVTTPSNRLQGSGGGFNYLVVGSGLSGASIARVAAEAGARVCVIEKRRETGGNCADYIDDNGFRVARYGPHFFHTANERVWEFVQRFSAWVPWEHRVRAFTHTHTGEPTTVCVPVNIDTVNTLYNAGITTEAEMAAWLAREQIPCASPANSRDVALSRVGPRLYAALFHGYTNKQWARGPEDLEPSVLARIPVRSNWDDRYFTDPHQALPRHGYSAFIANMLDHPNISIMTDTDYFAEAHCLKGYEKMFYTGPIDRYYADLGFDPLEYRTVEFQYATKPTPTPEARLQPTSQVNYPSLDVPYTRITEYKHLPNQATPSGLLHVPVTTLATEFSTGVGEPFYPVPAERNRVLYDKYRRRAAADTDIVFVGRLATMKYLNMDQAIAFALEAADEHVLGRNK